MEHNKKIFRGIRQPEKPVEPKKAVYVSPDNLDLLMSTLLLKDYRPMILSELDDSKKIQLENIATLYDQGELDNYKIAVVKSKNVLSTEKNYTLDMKVNTYHTGNQHLDFGEHTLKDMKAYFDQKNLEGRIYSDNHLIE